MTTGNGLADLLQEHLAPLGPVSVRRMFGGAGVFFDGVMFGLIIDEALYFKVAAGANQRDFEAEGLTPFSYRRGNGQTTVMSYWRAPERLFDDADEMLAWARKAIVVARASASKSNASKVRASKTPARRPRTAKASKSGRGKSF